MKLEDLQANAAVRGILAAGDPPVPAPRPSPWPCATAAPTPNGGSWPVCSARSLPPAAFVCPGHPLLDAVIDLTRERHRDLRGRGAVLVDERDPGTRPRLLCYLDYRPLAKGDPGLDALIAKTEAAVKERLTKEINYCDHRAEQLRLQEQAGQTGARLNSREARRRADHLQARLENRLAALTREAQLSPLPPVMQGGALVVPRGLLQRCQGAAPAVSTPDTQAAAARAREIVMEVERQPGFEPVDREFEQLGYDIESRNPGSGRLRFIEVKGRVSGAATLSVTRNEILYSLNKSEDYILGIVEFLDGREHRVHYVREPFRREPDFGVTSVNYDFAEWLARAETPG